MTVTPSQRGGSVPLPSPRRLPGAVVVPGSFFHRSSCVRQDLRDQRVQPLHRCPSVATSQSQPENPRCRSNQPSLEILPKGQMR